MKTLNQTITDHAFCHELKPAHRAILTKDAKATEFKAGEVLFREGEPANQFYLIESGQIALEVSEPGSGTVLVQTLSAGEVLGWSWLFAPFVWHFQARAIEPTHVIVLSGAHLLSTAERDHDFGFELMKRVAQLVIRRLQVTRRKLLDLQVESALES